MGRAGSATIPAMSGTEPSTTPAARKTNWKLIAGRAGMLLLLAGVTVLFYFIRDQVPHLRRFGYPGILVLNLIASGSIFLPIPALPVVFGMAAIQIKGALVFNWFWLGTAAAVGATLGELSGYAAGYSGQAVMERTGMYQRLHNWTERYGVLTLSVLAFIPNPLFDMAGIAAGTLKMSVGKFLLATLIGKLGKMWVVAYAGAHAIGWIARLMGL